MVKLKPEQSEAIYTRNKDILVSAGAGSGKTFVMINRIVDIIVSERKSIKNFLVVTFTNAAATEMRAKLEKELKKAISSGEYSADDIAHIRSQLDLLPEADICTLHKFCQNVLRKYFYCLDIDPTFSLADPTQTATISATALQNVIQNTIINPRYADLYLAFDDKRNTKKIADIILTTYNFLSNQPDLNAFRDRVNQSFGNGIDNAFTDIINRNTIQTFEFFTRQYQALHQDAICGGATKLVDVTTNILQIPSYIQPTAPFEANNFALFNLPEIPRTPTKKEEGTEGIYEDAKALRKALTDKLTHLRTKVHLSPNTADLLADLDNSHRLMNLIIDLVDLYRNEYQRIKHTLNVLDFGDLEHLSLRILQDENIASQIRDTYQYVFVDEYQDVNDIQENILTHIYSPGRVFLVGDVKQSIYGFRNTNPQIFTDKTIAFGSPENPHQTTIKLNYNFRSDKRVLEYINSVFNIVMTPAIAGIDYLSDGQLRAGLDDVPDSGMPIVEVDVLNIVNEKTTKPTPDTLYSVRDAETTSEESMLEAKSEAQIIISKIAEFMSPEARIFDLNTRAFRKVEFRDITLLVRSRGAYLDTIVNEIARVYPIESVTQDTVFLEYEVQVLYNYLRLINNPCDDIALTALLVSPIFNFTQDELANIRLHYLDSTYFYQCVEQYRDNMDDDISARLRLVYSMFEEGAYRLINGTIYELLNWFCSYINYFALIGALPNGQKRIDNVQGFINSFVTNPHNNDLFGFVSFVENNGNTLTVHPASSATQNTIKIATMHHSKGLEYPICFLIDTGHGFNKEATRGDILLSSTLGIGLFSYDRLNRVKNNTLSRTAIILSIIEKEFAEHQRLLYVAMTRAKNHLIIVGKQRIDKLDSNVTEYSIRNCGSNMSLILSSLPTSAIHALQAGQDKLIIHKGQPSEFLLRVFPVIPNEDSNHTFAPNPICTQPADDALLSKVQNYLDYQYPYANSTTIAYKNTVTGLLHAHVEPSENFVNTPISFSLKENIPDHSSIDVDAKLGTLYHKVMELIDFDLDSTDEVYDFCSKYFSADELKLIDCNKILACIRFVRPMLIDADEILREQQFLMHIPHNELVQSDVTDPILVQGIVDLIILKGDQAIIIDYKMTTITDPQKLAQKYRLQLLCYQKTVQSATKCRVTSKILYSFLQEMRIIV